MDSVTNEAGSTHRDPIPEGEYRAVIDDIDWREVPMKDGATVRIVMRVNWEIVDDDLRAQLDLPKVTVRQDIWIDEDKSRGGIDFAKGKNVGLGRLREALGQNNPGEAWNPGMLKGAGPAVIVVTQRPDKNSDVIYNDVRSVGQIT